jgi:hypothetical protein
MWKSSILKRRRDGPVELISGIAPNGGAAEIDGNAVARSLEQNSKGVGCSGLRGDGRERDPKRPILIAREK